MAALSKLQKSVLKSAFLSARPRVPRSSLHTAQPARTSPYAEEILGRSLERLIDRGFAVGYGHRTAEKWFIESIRLTTRGRQEARRLLGTQTSLPLN